MRKLFINPALLLSFLVLFTAAVYSSDGFISIQGIVKDSLGNVLSGVDIFVSSDNFNAKIFNTRTDENGCYLLEKVTAGAYKVAAAKKGYLTKVEDLNAQAESSLNLTLNRIAGDGTSQARAQFPDSLDWIRRIPKKDVLKESEAESLVAKEDSDNSQEVSQKALARKFSFKTPDSLPFEIELKQLASMEMSAGNQDGSGERRSRTSLSIASNIGPDCKVEMEGLKKRWKEEYAENLASEFLTRDSELIDLSGNYNFGEWGLLGFRTFYGTDNLNIRESQLSGFNPSEGAQNEWGYSADWRKNIDNDTAFNVKIAHSGKRFLGEPAVSELDDPSRRMSVYNNEINASGNFQTLLLKDHLIKVGILTQFYTNSDPRFHVISQWGTDSYTGLGDMGRNLSLYGRDSWTPLDPLTISFGLNYYSFYYDRGLQAVTPVLAFELKGNSGTSVKTEVAYIMDTIIGEGDVQEGGIKNASAISDARGDVSCKIDVKKEMRGSSSLTTSFSYTPLLILEEGNGFSDIPWNDLSLYITDGNATSKRVGTFFEKKFKALNGGVGLDYGEIEGTLSSLLPEDLPLQVLRQGNLNYLLAILRAYCRQSDTELSIRYRKVKDSIMEEYPLQADANQLRYSMISVQIGQKVPIFKIRGVNLKAILEYDDILAYDDVGSDPIKAFLLPARRIGGGLAVAF